MSSNITSVITYDKKGGVRLIKILCEKDYLSGYEKIQYAKAINLIIKALKELQSVIKKEMGVEFDYSVTIRKGGQ